MKNGKSQNYKVITENCNKALIEGYFNDSLKYAIITWIVPREKRKYEPMCWADSVQYFEHSTAGLSEALDCFRSRTESQYVSRDRLIELATLFKDGLLTDDPVSAMEYFCNVCDMDCVEKVLFGIEFVE